MPYFPEQAARETLDGVSAMPTFKRAPIGAVWLNTIRAAVGALGISVLASAAAAQTPQLRLDDPLDFPQEGYCVDVLGVGATARADLPLVAHNCLPHRESADRIVTIRQGRLFMPAFDACLTAFGVTTALPGSPIVLRPCGARESFLPADQLQRFEWTGEGRLRLARTNLCLTIGPDAHRTYSPTHRWRTLSMEQCGGERQGWLRPS